jgi:predicted ATPase
MSLPVQQSRFIGRVDELQVAGALLYTHRLVTLLGAGGSGKTRLAIQIAVDAAERFPAGVCWVPLAPVRDPRLVEQTIARSVGANGSVAEHLAAQSLLLVLDNVEQVVAAVAPLLASLLAACPSVHILVTSREPLRLTAEQRFTVQPLTPADAVALFVERARAVDPTFVEDKTVEAICSRLDRLPLALELAATRVNVLTLGALLTRLNRRLPMLTGGARDMPARHQTLRATIEWSEDLLSTTERELFKHLAIFPASFDLRAAEEVCAADLATISSLVDKSLVHRGRDDRFALLETVQEFAAERLTVTEQHELARRHGAYFTQAAEAMAGIQSWPSNPETFGELDDDVANLRAALDWTQTTSNADLCLRLGIALSRFWIDRGHRHDACLWLESAALEDASVSPSLRAAALEAAGLLDYFVVTDPDQAERYYTQSLALHRGLGNTQRVAFLLNRLGRIASERLDVEMAIGLHRDALGLFEAIADNAGRAATLHLLAGVALRARRFRAWSGTRCTASATWRWIAATIGVLWPTTRRAWTSPGQANAGAGSCVLQASGAPWPDWGHILSRPGSGERSRPKSVHWDSACSVTSESATSNGPQRYEHTSVKRYLSRRVPKARHSPSMRRSGKRCVTPGPCRYGDAVSMGASWRRRFPPMRTPGSNGRASTGRSPTRSGSSGFATARGSACSRTCLRTPVVRTRRWISNASAHHLTIRRPMRSRRAMRGSCSMRRHAGHTAPG